MTHTIIINEDGTSSQLGNPMDLPAEVVSSTRYSVIVPRNKLLRRVFVTARMLFGDDGVVADLTRRMPCMWQMRIITTGETAESRNRHGLIELEHGKFNQSPL